jgi:universal stress protein A
MTTYRKILAVLDLSADSLAVASRARALADATAGATLTLLHVVEYVPVEPIGDTLMPAARIESELIERARERITAIAAKVGGDPAWRVEAGNVKTEILRQARDGAFDLLVIGSHERHGLSILVNLTEDTVLHGAPCDVLAVRLAPPAKAT